jgi:hypothetical protein
MQCPRCQQENPTSHKFCRECGTPLARLEAGAQPALSYTEVQHSLTEALEQQTATSEILRVISSSRATSNPCSMPSRRNAARLSDAVNGLVIRFDGQLLHLAAHQRRSGATRCGEAGVSATSEPGGLKRTLDLDVCGRPRTRRQQGSGVHASGGYDDRLSQRSRRTDDP